MQNKGRIMVISDYSFGRIVISDAAYAKDVIIFPDRVFSPWWRGEGHLLQTADLDEVVKAGISQLIIGTGFYGSMKVPLDVLEYLNNKGIEVIVEKTKDAVDTYNSTISDKAAIAALHLTC